MAHPGIKCQGGACQSQEREGTANLPSLFLRLTRLADRLEREGLIRRESCSSDARGAYAVLTPAGAEMLAAARTTHLAGVRSLFLQHFADDELDALGDAWDRVVPGSASGPGPTCG